jgi:outer membrane protein insertion porin family
VDDFIEQYGDEYETYIAGLGWSRLTTNQAYFPTEGVDARVHGTLATPGSDLNWYKLGAHSKWYFPLWFEQAAFSVAGNAQYGNGYDDTDQLPFFKNYYGGGWGSVRGFSEGTLGAKDRVCAIGDPTKCSRGNALGGNLSLSLNFNLYLPVFFVKDSDRQRFVLFADMGNVYNTYDVSTAYDSSADTTPSFKNLRYSTGVAYIWASPMGNIGFSFSKSYNVKEGDDPNVFQFTINKSL